MLRAILKLIAVGAVIVVCGTADSIELYAVGGGALLALPFAIRLIDRRRARAIAERPRERTTLDVVPLPPPPAPAGDDDIEGVTVRAPMTHEEAYEMHARYAPGFDQQLAIARYEAQHGAHHRPASAPEPVAFDQGRYAAALQYAEAFEAQLTRSRRTAAYEVAPPRRMARGSVTPHQYRAVDMRSDQRVSDWEDKTLIGVPPLRPRK